MKYKEYLGKVTYDAKAKIFHGEVITFQGTNIKELERAFRDSIDDYISWCKEYGGTPQSNELLARIKKSLKEDAIIDLGSFKKISEEIILCIEKNKDLHMTNLLSL